jgi:pimeloyl-ACP methyl ester carboxylesterase
MSTRRTEALRLPLPEGGAVQAYLSYADSPGPWAVLFVHGLGSTRLGEKAQAMEAACARRGWPFAAFDFRGHGQSTGEMIELRGSGLLADLETVQAALAARGVRRLGLVGSSMGGWASAWYTVRHPEAVAACVLVAPAFDFVRGRFMQLAEAEREEWRRTGRMRVRNEWIDLELGYGLVEDLDHFPPELLPAEFTPPLLILHGMRDTVVPYRHSIAFAERAEAADVEVRLFNTGDHRLLEFKEEIAEAACQFFARCVAEIHE